MSLNLLNEVLEACHAPTWSGNNDAVDLVVEKGSIVFDTLRQLQSNNIYAEGFSNAKIQADFNSNKAGELPLGTKFRLRLPRIVAECVVAKNLADLLSVDSATYREPRSYFLVGLEKAGGSFCYAGDASLPSAPALIKNYHDAIRLWELIKGQAEHVTPAHNLLFFGLRRTEIAPRFTIDDLGDKIALSDIAEFIRNADRTKTRKEIFHSILSEFLRDQMPDRSYSYLLRQSELFARRLKEGLAIYLSNYSPEKLSKDAQVKHLELAERLEKIIGGIEAKSLTIPAAVLFAIKEVTFAGRWTTLNVIILISTGLYLVAMIIAHCSQISILRLLKTTISKTTAELRDQGLDESNPVLSESFRKLENRQHYCRIGSWLMFSFSFVPLLAVIYAAFFSAAPEPPTYLIKLAPTNTVQIIQGTDNQGASSNLKTNPPPSSK